MRLFPVNKDVIISLAVDNCKQLYTQSPLRSTVNFFCKEPGLTKLYTENHIVYGQVKNSDPILVLYFLTWYIR